MVRFPGTGALIGGWAARQSVCWPVPTSSIWAIRPGIAPPAGRAIALRAKPSRNAPARRFANSFGQGEDKDHVAAIGLIDARLLVHARARAAARGDRDILMSLHAIGHRRAGHRRAQAR